MKLKYRPEVDGLRAIAVLPVILFHLGSTFFSGGYTGVDVFFVISGYLITSIIYKEVQANSFSIVTFYERRARRILPLLFVVLFISLPLAWYSLFISDIIDYFESLIAVPLFGSNFLFLKEANYFDASSELKPLLHTWSLAVEEQFYIFFPLFIIAAYRLKLFKHLFRFVLFISMLSFVLAIWAAVNRPYFNFYLLPTRIWELGVGALLAIASLKESSRYHRLRLNENWSQALSILGLILILVGVFTLTEKTPFPSVYALYPVMGSVLVIGFANDKNWVGKLLSLRIMVLLGLMSYSAYLWHHLFFAFGRHFGYLGHNFTSKMLFFIIVFPVSYLSMKYVENPFRNKQRFGRKKIFTYSIIMSLFFIAVGSIGLWQEGFPNRRVNKKLAIANYNPDNRELQNQSGKNRFVEEMEKELTFWVNDSSFQKVRLLIIGNSHSIDLLNILHASDSSAKHFSIIQKSHEIREFKNPNHEIYNAYTYQHADMIMIVAKYFNEDIPHIQDLIKQALKDGKKAVAVKEIHGFKVVNGKTEADNYIQKAIRNNQLKTGLDEYETVANAINQIYYEDSRSNFDQRQLLANRTIDSLAMVIPELVVLNRMDYLIDEEKELIFAINKNLEKYFYDYGHHTLEGANFYGKRVDSIDWLAPVFTEK